ncbi:MAG: lipopolysaccharide heptosyltransferase II [Planctomycetota bacterium]|jgi:heptosyltransferase-2
MSPPSIGEDLERVAVILPSWVGDTVMATPVLRALRQACPRAHLTGVMRPGLEELVDGTPWLDTVVTGRMRGWAGPARLGARLRGQRLEAILLLPNSFRSALAAWFSRAPRRVGYARDARRLLLTHPVTVQTTDQPTPTVQYYARLARIALELDSIDPRLELATTPAQEAAADELLRDVTGPFLILNPGANKLPKRWPPERFAAAADELAAAHGLNVLVTGSPGESELAGEVVQAASAPVTDLTARRVTLGSLKAVLRRAALLITNDTGPRHIAAALGTPTVTLFGPTDHRWTTIDFDRQRLVLADPFLPEELVADRCPKRCAIERISVGDVVAAGSALLADALAPEPAP